MNEDINDEVGSFSSSCSEDAETAQLSMLYDTILSRFESLFRGKNRILEALGAELDDLLLQLRLWATDIKVETSSLDLLDREYCEEAAAVRIHLQNVSSALEDLEAEDLSETTSGIQNRKDSFVEALRVSIRDLAELAEPIQVYVDLHRGQGPLSKVKNALVERQTQRRWKGIHNWASIVSPTRLNFSTGVQQDSQKYIHDSTGVSSYSFTVPTTLPTSLNSSVVAQPADHKSVPDSTDSFIVPPSSNPSVDPQLPSQQYQQYYLPATSYPQETPNYGPELVIDSTEEEQDSFHYPSQTEPERARLRAQVFAAVDSSLYRASSQQDPQTTNFARTPTARRWSREYSPAERMRIGLPRWETEQHRIDYERQQRQSQRRS